MESPLPRRVARRVWEGGCRLRAFRKKGLRAVPLPHQTRTLLIVDNIDTIADAHVIEFLREIPPPTKVIVTPRQRIDMLNPIEIELKPLSALDAQSLIKQVSTEKNVILSQAQQQTLYERTGRIPIVIVWSIAQIAFGFGVDVVTERLSDRQGISNLVQFCFDGRTPLTGGKES